MTSARCRRFPTAPRARVALFTHSTGSLLLSRSLSDWNRADNALRHFFRRRVPHLAGSNIQTFRVTRIWPAPSFRFCEDSEPSRDTPAHRDNLRTFKAMTTSATMPLMGQAALRLIPQSAQLDVGLIAPSIVCSFSPTASYPACPDLGFRLGVSTRFDLVCLTDSLNSYGCGFQYCFVPDDVVTCAALLLGRPVRGK